jgi:hypothetical protein
MSEQPHYNDTDAEEILRIASRDSALGGMSRDRLMQTAAELGISPDAVLRAEEQMVKEREANRVKAEDELLRTQYDQQRRRRFLTEFLTYVGVNAGLIGIWAMSGASYFWPGWVLVGWGIGVVTDFVKTFFDTDEAKFQRWKKRTHNKLASAKSSDQARPMLDDITATGDITKIEAIKELRERLSIDLREAKNLADTYEQEHPGVFS